MALIAMSPCTVINPSTPTQLSNVDLHVKIEKIGKTFCTELNKFRSELNTFKKELMDKYLAELE